MRLLSLASKGSIKWNDYGWCASLARTSQARLFTHKHIPYLRKKCWKKGTIYGTKNSKYK